MSTIWIHIIGISVILFITISSFISYLTYIKHRNTQTITKLKEKNDLLNLSLEHVSEGIWRYDFKKGEWWVHELIEKMLGIEGGQQWDGESLLQLIHKDYRNQVIKAADKLLKEKKNVQGTIKFHHSSGTENWLYISAYVVDRDLEPQGNTVVIGVCSDISNIIANEEALKSSYQQLDLITHQNRNFLTKMSHDVRTPLNAIAGYTQLLERELTDPKYLQHINTIKQATGALVNVMNQIIDAGRIESGQIQIAQDVVNIQHMLEQLRKVFKDEAEKKQLIFEVQYDSTTPLLAVVDEMRLYQVLFNLLQNAIKYTDYGFIRLTLRTDRYAYRRVAMHFIVEDSGCGIDNEKIIAYLNEPNDIKDQRINLVVENGLGLSVVDNLIRMMGGTLRVSTHTGFGTTFHVSVNAILSNADNKSLSEPENDITTTNNWRIRKPKVLVAEDNEVNQALIEDMLHFLNIESIDVVADGNQALARSLKYHYDLILTDIQMPVMNGTDFSRQYRMYNHHVPIVAMTANVLEEQLKDYELVGITDYLAKPVDLEHLKALLNKYL